jgi:Tfp pilus assembly protein PilO
MTTIKLPNFIKKQPVAVVCALLCVGLGMAIYFRKDSLAEANDILAQKKSDGEHLRDNVTNASKLDEQFAAMTQAIQAIEARLVHADQLPINKQYFYKIQAETQTKLTGVNQSGVATPGKNAGKTAYVAIVYAISVEGTYTQLLDFMRRVENGEHFARVQGLTLARASGGENTPGNTGSLSLNLNLELLGLPGLP